LALRQSCGTRLAAVSFASGHCHDPREFKTFNGTTSIKEVSARYVFVIFFFFFGFVAMT
jgi:hypothetical protein